MKISVLGATGAMGGLTIKSALQEGHFIANKASSKDSIEKLFSNTDVVIDFSCPIATENMLKIMADGDISVPVVIGTTGLSDMHKEMMRKCSLNAPVFYSTNMSFLISVLNAAIYFISTTIGEDYDAEILDVHHKLKKDAPSGTALMLGETIAKARGREFREAANFVRYGIVEQRKKGEIGFSSQRCGEIVGVHEVSFAGEYENIKIKHESFSREIFAKGAIKAAQWLVKQPKGFYSMNDFTKDSIVPCMIPYN